MIKKCLLRFLLFVLPLCVSLFISLPVSASDVKGDFTSWVGSRSYASYSSSGFTWSDDIPFSGTTGSMLLGTNYYMSGFSLTQPGISGFLPTDNPPMYFTMVLNVSKIPAAGQSSITNTGWWNSTYAPTPSSIPVSCTLVDNYGVTHRYDASVVHVGNQTDGFMVSWRCTFTVSEFANVTQAGFYLGSLSDHIPRITSTPNDLVLVGASYRFITGSDASSDILNSQLRVQEQIRDGVGQTTDAVNNQGRAVVNSINNLSQTMEESNDDAQARWEADKQEEAEREEQGQSDAGALGRAFSFSISNPFIGFLGLFTDSCPVSIPIISSMLHSEESSYSCWFSSQTRSIVTPVIGISASVLLFGFIVRGFLRKGNFSGGIEV